MTGEAVVGHLVDATDPLVIRVSTGTGEGPTELAAFDAALRSAGVADHNLIRLSSMIPTGAVVAVCRPEDQLRAGFGDALYCVYAAAWATEPGDEAWAGVGWALAQDGSGRGLFVEHEGSAGDQVRAMIATSLAAMSRGRDQSFAFTDQVLGSARCTGQPVCSVVVATYRTAGWRVA